VARRCGGSDDACRTLGLLQFLIGKLPQHVADVTLLAMGMAAVDLAERIPGSRSEEDRARVEGRTLGVKIIPGTAHGPFPWLDGVP
jgi:hypothetical protein